jgi:hypothetical protein
MKVRILHTIPSDEGQQSQPLEDLINWPDVEDSSMLPSLVDTYLVNKYGAGNYQLVHIEEVAR